MNFFGGGGGQEAQQGPDPVYAARTVRLFGTWALHVFSIMVSEFDLRLVPTIL